MVMSRAGTNFDYEPQPQPEPEPFGTHISTYGSKEFSYCGHRARGDYLVDTVPRHTAEEREDLGIRPATLSWTHASVARWAASPPVAQEDIVLVDGYFAGTVVLADDKLIARDRDGLTIALDHDGLVPEDFMLPASGRDAAIAEMLPKARWLVEEQFAVIRSLKGKYERSFRKHIPMLARKARPYFMGLVAKVPKRRPQIWNYPTWKGRSATLLHGGCEARVGAGERSITRHGRRWLARDRAYD